MSREKDAYRQIRENAQRSYQHAEVYDAEPSSRIKTNYISAIVWTSIVAAIVCSVFMGLLMYFVNESNLEENLQKAANHAVISLERVIRQQNEEIKTLQEENKKIYKHIKFWTPLDCSPRLKEEWKIPGYGLPEVPIKKYNSLEWYGDAQCYSY
jgi:hypothetical protein